MKKRIGKQICRLFCFFIVLATIVPSINVLAASPGPVLDLRLIGNIESVVSGTPVREPVQLTWSGKSLWFNDGDLAYNVISTHDNHGTVKHDRSEVTVVVQQTGQGDTGGYTRVNGERKAISANSNVISAYPNQFIEQTTYTITANDVDPDEPYTIFTFGHIGITHAGTSTPYTRYETNVYIYWDDSDLAPAPNTSFVYDAASGRMVLSGANSTMEYRLRNGTTWTPCTNEPMYFDCVAGSERSYLVRYAASGDDAHSQSQEVILPALRSAPSVTYNTSTEVLSGLTTSMELRLDDGPYEAITDTSMDLADIVNTIPAGSTSTIGVRYKATATQQAGAERTITLYPRNNLPTGVVFDPVTLTLSGYTTAMEYKGDTDTSWKALSGSSLSLQSYARGDREVTIYVRMEATSTSSVSQPIEFTIPQLVAGPTGQLDYSAEAVVELTNGSYQYSTNGTSWTALTISNNQWNISNLISSSARTLYLRWAATSTTPISAATTFALPARLAAPSTPAFDYSVTGQATLTGVTTEMEYRTSSETAWTSVPSNSGVIFEIPAASTTYYVRIKATDQSFTSSNKTLTLSKPGTAPSCSYNTTTELISSLSTAMEMKIGNGAYTPVTATTFSTSELIDSLPAGGSMVISVRKMATTTVPASADKVFTLYARSAAPTTLVYNTATNSLTGCSSSMQYQLEGATSWTSISGTTLNLQSFASSTQDVKVYVRMKPTSTAAASNAVEFTIPQMLPGPTGTIDYLSEAITGLANGNYQYSTNASSWTALTVTNGKWDISSLVTTSTRNLYLRWAATDTAPLTNYTIFSIAARPTAPSSLAFDYSVTGKATLTGVTTAMEYKLSTATEWTTVTDAPITLDIPASSVTYYVRYKSTAQAFASSNRSVTLSKAGSAPSCSLNTTTEVVNGLSTAMEMKIGSGAYAPVTATTFLVSDLIDSLPGGGSMEIRIRTMATATSPASAERIITLYARSAAPTTLVYNPGTNSLSGCSSAMQYQLEGATGWSSISGTTLNLQSYASTEQDVKVYVRMKPTSTAAASEPVEFTIPQMLPGPVGTIDYLNDAISGLSNGSYQYSTNRSSWTAVEVTNGMWDISSLLTTSSRTLYLRWAATATTPITNYTAFSIAARPTAPSTPAFTYVDTAYPDKALLTGVTSDMQYKKTTDTEWTNITGTQVVFDVPSTATSYYVRTKSSSDNWSSANRTVTLAKRANAPSCSYSASTGLISGVKTTMEISIAGGAYNAIEATTYDVSHLVDTLSGDETIEVRIRIKATTTTPASLEKVLTIGARA